MLYYCATAKNNALSIGINTKFISLPKPPRRVPDNEINEVLFWTSATIATLIGIFGTIANVLVIYFAKQEPPTGTLRRLNRVVKQLAISDILIAVLACPLKLAYWKLGKT